MGLWPKGLGSKNCTFDLCSEGPSFSRSESSQGASTHTKGKAEEGAAGDVEQREACGGLEWQGSRPVFHRTG